MNSLEKVNTLIDRRNFMKKFYSLRDNEQIVIVNPKNNTGILIQNKDDSFLMKEIEKIEENDNVFITEIDYQKLKKYFLFEEYYWKELLHTNPKERAKLNKMMNKLISDLFGKDYLQKDINIVKESYQVITTFEKN